MEMDRQTLTVIAAAALVLAFCAGFFFSPNTPVVHSGERPAYSQDDIRYKYQQAELKAQKKNKGHRGTPPSDSSGDGSGSDSSSDDGSQSSNEAPSLDHAPEEEPPIE